MNGRIHDHTALVQSPQRYHGGGEPGPVSAPKNTGYHRQALPKFHAELRRNLMITLRLSCHETDANQFREEGRHFHLDRHDRLRLYDRRYDLRALVMRLIEPWTPLACPIRENAVFWSD
jgi:hypothetical protein